MRSRIHELWQLISGHHLTYWGAMLCAGFEALFQIANYLLIKFFVDSILGQGISDYRLSITALGFIGLVLFQGFFSFAGAALSAKTAEIAVLRLRTRLFDHFQRMSFKDHDRATPGDLIQRSISDVDKLRDLLGNHFPSLGYILFLFCFGVVALIRMNLALAFLSVIIGPPLVLISAHFSKKVSAAYEKYQEEGGRLSTLLQRNLSSIRLVKAFDRQTLEMGYFANENDARFLAGRRLALSGLSYRAALLMVGHTYEITALFVSAIMAINGTITIGDYVAYFWLLRLVMVPAFNLSNLIVKTSAGLVSLKRVTESLGHTEEDLQQGSYLPSSRPAGTLAFRDVCFTYDGCNPVLQNVSFNCEAGQMMLILGLTGSGKTTLLRLIPRFYDYTYGSITLDGIELKEYPLAFLRKQIAVVEQEPFLFSSTIQENITYGLSHPVPMREIKAVADIAQIHSEIMAFPNKYDTVVGERGMTLSGGQKQRIAIARALLRKTPLLILDNPFSSLDANTQSNLLKALESQKLNQTIIVSSSHFQGTYDVDTILVLDNGRPVEYGTHNELKQRNGAYQKILQIERRIEKEIRMES